MTFKLVEGLQTELNEVTEKLNRLEIFISKQEILDIENRVVDEYHLGLLKDQEYAMTDYAKVLRLRIADIRE